MQVRARRRARAAGEVPIVAYHGIDDADMFTRQLDHLVRHHRPVSEGDVLAAVGGGRRLPEGAVLVTFDDGQRTVFDIALPLLRERGIPAVAYVVAGLLDTDTPYWWQEVEHLAVGNGRDVVRRLKRVPDAERLQAIEQLRRDAVSAVPPTPQLRRDELAVLESAGIAVGNHSLTHPLLPHCDDATIAREVADAHALLTDALGHPPRSFAYPNGDCDDRSAAAVAAAGYELAFLFDHQLAAFPPADALRVSRVRVDSTTSIDRFRIILSGLHPALHRARGRS
jgi:peptidoglycan/xylan/chitin deacetylase (PgdA/CDA1 family)